MSSEYLTPPYLNSPSFSERLLVVNHISKYPLAKITYVWISLNLYFFTIDSKSFTKFCWYISKINLVWIYFFLSPLQPLWSMFSLNLTGLLKVHLRPPSSHDFLLLVNVLHNSKNNTLTNKQTNNFTEEWFSSHSSKRCTVQLFKAYSHICATITTNLVL